jgi:SAM-dependent methyltransferase
LEYSNIPLNQQSKHVHKIRDKAWAIRSYPCTGLGVWLMPYISHSPVYMTVVKRLQDGGTLMDVGCFMGDDLRRLAYDGAPSDKMYGVDIVSHWEVGFAMYRDEGRFKAQFIEASILEPEANPQLAALKRKIDVISISAVLHQWPWDTQLECAKQLVNFSKPGTIVMGHQMGNVKAGDVSFAKQGTTQWRQNPESLGKLWDQVGEATGTAWETKARLFDFADIGWDPEAQKGLGTGAKIIDWVITRTK